MALTLNGSANTIAGVAVGGLPDGIVDTDMIATEAVTGVKQGPGSIVQYVQAVPADIHHRFTTSSDNPTYVDTDIHIDITPTNATNRIVVGGWIICTHTSDSVGSQYCVGVGSTAPTTGLAVTHNQMSGSYPIWASLYQPVNFRHQQIAGTTSEMTFKLYMRRSGNSGSVSIGWGSSPGTDDRNSHDMWAMEVVV